MISRMYSMEEALGVAADASKDIEAWLLKQPETERVENVEDDPKYQKIDVDLLWHTKDRCYQVEIKGDRNHDKGNFFLETISNKKRGTPGCFLYTEAHFVFYYFLQIKTLYILPMPESRDWFLERMQDFPERQTKTPTKDGKYYPTVGRIVPIQEMVGSLKSIRVEKLYMIH